MCAVGANDPSRRELDNVVLERAAFVCCDSREQSMLESGDLIEPVERGVLDWLEVHELQEVVAGQVQGRASRRGHRRSSSRTGSRPGISPSARRSSSSRGSGASAASSSRGSRTPARAGDARRALRGDQVVADRVHDLGLIEQPPDLLGRAAVRHVGVLEDLLERAPAMVLADHVLGHELFLAGAGNEKAEGCTKDVDDLATQAVVRTSIAGPRVGRRDHVLSAASRSRLLSLEPRLPAT